jgi:hypothetical protein
VFAERAKQNWWTPRRGVPNALDVEGLLRTGSIYE